MAENDFQYGGWNYYTLQCGLLMTLILPGNCTLQCGIWLWNHDTEFTKRQHPAMWHVALWSWLEFARWQHPAMYRWLWDDIPWNSPKRPPYWNSTSGFDFDHITAVDMSFCTNLQNFIQIGPSSAEKMTSCRFSRWRISAILDFRDPVLGSLKSPCMTSYRSSTETIALSCLVFGKIMFFCILATNWQTNKQTDGQPHCTKPLSLLWAAA